MHLARLRCHMDTTVAYPVDISRCTDFGVWRVAVHADGHPLRVSLQTFAMHYISCDVHHLMTKHAGHLNIGGINMITQ